MKKLFFTWIFMSLIPVLIFGVNIWTGLWLVFTTIGTREEYKKLKAAPIAEPQANTSQTPKPSPRLSSTNKSGTDNNFAPKAQSRTASSYTKQQLRQIAFDYTDSEGVSSYREVAVNSVDDYYIKAFCLSRHATRTFRIDRVDGYITMRETGELLSVSDWLHLYR